MNPAGLSSLTDDINKSLEVGMEQAEKNRLWPYLLRFAKGQ